MDEETNALPFHEQPKSIQEQMLEDAQDALDYAWLNQTINLDGAAKQMKLEGDLRAAGVLPLRDKFNA